MNIQELAEMYYDKLQEDQELKTAQHKEQPDLEAAVCVQDQGDEIYCRIGELLQEIPDSDLAERIDLMVLEMSDADRQEYFIKGFMAAANMLRGIK